MYEIIFIHTLSITLVFYFCKGKKHSLKISQILANKKTITTFAMQEFQVQSKHKET